ncbi:unnamed protein product [Didymodactylos carnosus]|uniref:RBR-type E3 ubiquitin transferase n=1 Tax=Didymodactylos carnosus TaxID=1234261 RepID=A0A813SYN3_9BILA|nr:unnamed protein product [Didymodactylos carnosus]CAF0807190.1 unnamed protein product [Didymodactylos carnosus]CAF3515217.1 unnamed protein product [Didymodactylos carnosus]CAF3592690.1 unnamed protein product [Didymodactylos carnosus]
MSSDDEQYQEEEEEDDEDDHYYVDPSFEPFTPSATSSTSSEHQLQSSKRSKPYLPHEQPSMLPAGTHQQDNNFEYVVLTQEEIWKYMEECIREVNEVIKLPETTVRLLLHHFRWDKEKLMERFYDPHHQDELFRQAHIVNPFTKQQQQQQQQQQQAHTHFQRHTRRQNSTASASASPSTNILSNPLRIEHQMCTICCCTKPSNDMSGLECGHAFCTSCWRSYLTMKIMHEGIGQTIPCPAKCDILVDDGKVLELIKDQDDVRRKYQHLITNSFVECNRNMRWCPGKNCTNAIKAPYCDAQLVTCTSCHTSFCFQCSEQWHEPIKCKWLKKWHKKCRDDSETSNWIAANTKECPKCHATIEKNGGCNHLICKNLSCKYDFCWVCLGAWEPHGSSWYNCNRFNEDDAKKARDEQERSRAALQRYLHYYKRYNNHHESLRLESKLLEQVQKRMEILQQQMSWIEVQFLQNACEVLRQCRQTLMYTYPFAFYLKRNNNSIIFEQNQADLEHATEELSGYLERDISETINLSEMKQKVQDKYRYCDNRRKVLLAHVYEGYDTDYWEYCEDA